MTNRVINLMKADRRFRDNKIVTSKYTLITFLPKNLFEQFRRMINFFFLCLLVIQVSIDIPVNPIPYAAAFIFVIAVTGIKQGYEDWRIHVSDNNVNYAKVTIMNDEGSSAEINAKDIRVGQLVKLENDESVPCDVLIVACSMGNEVSSSQSFCQVNTSNLDGESNLKMRFPVSGLLDEFKPNSTSFQHLSNYRLNYEEPNAELYCFRGQIESPNLQKPIAVTMDNVLLRGCRMKNCKNVYGIAIYAGKETRLSMNSKLSKARSKFSTIEHTMNKIVISMFLFLLVLTSISVGLSFMYRDSRFRNAWYLPPNKEDTDFEYFVTIFFSYLVLLCYVIPVSLSVTFELQKLGCSKFFTWDKELEYEDLQTKPLCNTSDLNEELGQIEYLFTDKTGTLTDNDLIFRCCSINGIKYDYDGISKITPRLIKEGDPIPQGDEEAHTLFFTAAAVCHTVKVLPLTTPQQPPQYQAESLDEEVLVKFAYSLGYQYVGREGSNVTMGHLETKKEFTVLATLEFDSERKCMSILVEDVYGKFFLFSKGAESSLIPKCSITAQSLINTVMEHTTDFAKMGYRTLVFACKELQKSEAEEFVSKFEEYRSNNQDDKIRELYATMESDLKLLGCTGLEDKLQDGVPETVRKLKQAGIKILMLTGDKLETAVSVAFSCGLIDENASEEPTNSASTNSIITIENVLNEASLEKQLQTFQESAVLVMDGNSLSMALENHQKLLRRAILSASSTVFCRMAPLQKSEVVGLVKRNPKKSYKTCAVGDGGNDCSMLREAHIGIGIIGKEGLQAARESDFAIPRFKFLQKAILVHGHWYYHRLANLILYFFYRGAVFIFQIFLYGFDSGFSAQTIFDSTFVMMFTIAFTSIPVLIQGVTEQPFSKQQLLINPNLYKNLQRNGLMNYRSYLRWFLLTLWHALICYYVPKWIWMDGILIDEYGSFSLLVSSLIVIITDTKILIETRYVTSLTLISQLLSYFIMLVFYLLICHAITDGNGLLAFSYIPMLQNINVWIIAICTIILSVMPDLIYSSLRHAMGSL